MNSELDRLYDPFEHNHEYEEWLDEIHAQAEAERIEQEIEEIERRNALIDLMGEDEFVERAKVEVPF